MRWTVRLEARTDTGEVETTELVTIGLADYAACHRVCPQCRVPQPPSADLVRHGRGGGAAVPGLPLPPVGAHGGGDALAGLRPADRPLHAGAGAGAGRARGTHLVPGGRPDPRGLAARPAGEP